MKVDQLTSSVILASLLLLTACGGPTRFLDPEADLVFYERVGVLPFNSLAQDRLAGEKMADVFFTELMAKDFASVVEPGQFLASMLRVRGGTPVTNPWSSADIKQLGDDVGVQGVFMGTVRNYEMVTIGREQYPLISAEVRLVDTATGRIVWSASDTRRGGPGAPIFGFGVTRSLGELATKVAADLLDTLPKRR